MIRRLALTVAIAAAAAGEAVAAPAVVVQPAASPPGRLVTVSGSGFCAAPGCSTVRIFVFGNPVASEVRVASDGTFSHRVRVPGVTSPEENGVLAVQQLATGAETSAFADFQVVLRIKRPSTTSRSTTSPTPTTTAPPATTAQPPAPTDAPESTQAPPAPTTPYEPTTTSTVTDAAPPAPTQTDSDEIPTTPADTHRGGPRESTTAEPAPAANGADDRTWPWPAVLVGLAIALAAAGVVRWAARRGR